MGARASARRRRSTGADRGQVHSYERNIEQRQANHSAITRERNKPKETPSKPPGHYTRTTTISKLYLVMCWRFVDDALVMPW